LLCFNKLSVAAQAEPRVHDAAGRDCDHLLTRHAGNVDAMRFAVSEVRVAALDRPDHSARRSSPDEIGATLATRAGGTDGNVGLASLQALPTRAWCLARVMGRPAWAALFGGRRARHVARQLPE
jgi:hypothetical protein